MRRQAVTATCRRSRSETPAAIETVWLGLVPSRARLLIAVGIAVAQTNAVAKAFLRCGGRRGFPATRRDSRRPDAVAGSPKTPPSVSPSPRGGGDGRGEGDTPPG